MYLHIVQNHAPTNCVPLSLHITAGTSNTVNQLVYELVYVKENQCRIIACSAVLACSPTLCLSLLCFFLDFLPTTATKYPLWRSTPKMTRLPR